MTSFTISDDFSELKDFIHNLPENFHKEGTILQDERNIIKEIPTPKGSVVVKYFKGMYFFNRLSYSLFRRSKAARSYRYSMKLKNKGILIPPPIAYINRYAAGLLMESYFVSLMTPYPTLRQMLARLANGNEATRLSLLHHFAAFTKQLHDSDVYHADYSLGNVLIIEKEKGFDFSLVDLNRVKFRKVSYHDGLRNFITMDIDPGINEVIKEYARLCGQPTAEAEEFFWAKKKRASSLRSLRRTFRRKTLGRLEKIFNK